VLKFFLTGAALALPGRRGTEDHCGGSICAVMLCVTLRSRILQTLCHSLQDFVRKLIVRHSTRHSDGADETAIDRPVLLMYQGKHLSRGECIGPRGRYVPYEKTPSTLTLFESGRVPPVRLFTEVNLMTCAINPALLSSVAAELRDERGLRSSLQSGGILGYIPEFQDAAIPQLLMLLGKEARSGGLSGSLYLEHLVHAVACRLLTRGLGYESAPSLGPSKTPLHPKVLRRVIDLMRQSSRAGLTLSSLASEAGYGKSHFLRAFRASMGVSPHQYIVHRRLEEAKRLMLNRDSTLLEIAAECGFGSHAHLSETFR
jgi:AraC family transcriptional regulator